MKGDGRACERPPFGGYWEREPGAIVESFFDGGEFQQVTVQLQLDLGGEDDLPFTCVGHYPHPGGCPLGIHGFRDGL